jgi:CobQ/CobB/MinD/ParA nucleotide binding domain
MIEVMDSKTLLWLLAMLKGGSRKSTTTMMLAFALASRGRDVLVIDADHGTQGVTDWATRVYADGGELPFHVAQWTPRLGLLVPFIQQQQRETLAGDVLVDVGGEAPEVLRQVVLVATRVITPTGAEQGELARLPATAAIVRPAGVRHSVLLARVPSPGRGAARDARRDLTEGGYEVLATEIQQHRERYADIWGTVPADVYAYGDLADELLKGE